MRLRVVEKSDHHVALTCPKHAIEGALPRPSESDHLTCRRSSTSPGLALRGNSLARGNLIRRSGVSVLATLLLGARGPKARVAARAQRACVLGLLWAIFIPCFLEPLSRLCLLIERNGGYLIRSRRRESEPVVPSFSSTARCRCGRLSTIDQTVTVTA